MRRLLIVLTLGFALTSGSQSRAATLGLCEVWNNQIADAITECRTFDRLIWNAQHQEGLTDQERQALVEMFSAYLAAWQETVAATASLAAASGCQVGGGH